MRILPNIVIKASLIQALPMGLIFKDEQLNEFGCWALAYIPYGGADFGEIVAVADEVDEGDDSAFYAAWVSAGDRLAAEAETALADGHRKSARELFLRASCFYGLSYRPLYGEPVDPLPNIDPKRIVLSGWSLGGYLAVRAASGEHRLAACIADPGLFSMSAGFGKFLSALSLPAGATTNLGDLDESILTKISAMIGAHPRLTWSVLRRGYWVQGVRSGLAGYHPSELIRFETFDPGF